MQVLGDEDLGGHEAKPTLKERKLRFGTELDTIDESLNAVCDISLDCMHVTDVTDTQKRW